MMDVINDSEADTESDTGQVQYAQGEVENFAGEYQGSDAVTLYISLGTEVPSVSSRGEIPWEQFPSVPQWGRWKQNYGNRISMNMPFIRKKEMQ